MKSSPTYAASDRLDLMQTFVRIVEAGSLSAAAAQLGTTQPTVSRRLQLLERMLGVRLLQRSTHAMQLTGDGQRGYERAKELLAQWTSLQADLRGVRDEPEGTLRVVAPHAFGQHQLVAPVTEYLRRYPRVSVEWLLQDRMPDFIAENIDCAIHVGNASEPGVVAIKLADVPRIAVASPALFDGDPPRHPDQMAVLPWLALRTFYRSEIALTHCGSGETRTIAINPRLSTDSLYAVRNAAVLGMGVCVASSWAMREELAQGKLVQLAPQWQAAPLPFHIVYPHARHYPAKLRRFIDLLKETAPALLPELG
ncbi:LysR family transcriptional regulator [Oxalobacteraceae bacterium A2-2]